LDLFPGHSNATVRSMTTRSVIGAAVLVPLLVACAHAPAMLQHDVVELPDCEPGPATDLTLTASILPVEIPQDVASKGAHETHGLIARRLTATFAPRSARAAGNVLWAKLSFRAFGGTVEGWTRLKTGDLERAVVDFGPGYLTVTRTTLPLGPVTSRLRVDLLMLPGGIPIEESLIRIPALWTSSGAPLPEEAVRVELEPMRHAPGYDVVEADVVLDYAIAPRKAGMACRASARTRVVVIDKEAVRPPLWDVGTSAENGPRNRWLALSSPANGVFRAVFDSPAAANSFANWIRATRSTRIDGYQLGLFRGEGREPLRPLVPVDVAATGTFQPLAPEGVSQLRIGPLGEP
jgi:hypothetical protein